MFEYKIIFAALASVSSILFAFTPYLRDMLRGKTKPHIYTWLIWTITMGTALVGLYKGNGGWAMVSLSVGTLGVFVIFLFSFKYGTKNITTTDTIILIALFLAILIWWQLQNAVLAIFMASAIDVGGYLPSFRKSYVDPWSETITTWIVFSLNNYLSIAALKEYNFLTLTYLLSISSANFILIGICLVRRKIIRKVPVC